MCHNGGMSSLENLLVRLEAFTGHEIPLTRLSELSGIGRNTLVRKAAEGRLEARNDGYRYWVPKPAAKKLLIQHRPAIQGWIRRTDLGRSVKLSRSSIAWICRPQADRVEPDAVGELRVSPTFESTVRKLAPHYRSGDMAIIHGVKYYSLLKAAKDTAKVLCKAANRGGCNKLAKTLYGTFHSWYQQGRLDTLSKRGLTRLYVTEDTHQMLTSTVRVEACSTITGLSKVQMHSWVREGLLSLAPYPGKDRAFSIHDIDMALVKRLQKKISRNKAIPQNEIGDFSSNTWRNLVGKLKEILRLRKASKTSDKDVDNYDYAAERLGMDRGDVRAILKVKKIRVQSKSLDVQLSDDSDSPTVADTLPDERVVNTASLFVEEEAKSILTPEEYNVLSAILGIYEETLDDRDLEQKFGQPADQLRQSAQKSLAKLRNHFQAPQDDGVQESE